MDLGAHDSRESAAVDGTQLKEGFDFDQSLTTIGKVFSALADSVCMPKMYPLS